MNIICNIFGHKLLKISDTITICKRCSKKYILREYKTSGKNWFQHYFRWESIDE